MHPGQVEHLKFLVSMKIPTIPFYVCTIKGASTEKGKSRMVNNDYISCLTFASLYIC